jgi:hypothetical protein
MTGRSFGGKFHITGQTIDCQRLVSGLISYLPVVDWLISREGIMASGNQLPVRLAFGPFEVNTSTGELLKGGTRVRLPAQPFAILLVLLRTPGELVAREQLREQIWGEGTFVDFEHGLNAAMNKLRRALSDSAENPRYIETMPGRAVTVLSECWTPGKPCQFPFSPSRRLAKSIHDGGVA